MGSLRGFAPFLNPSYWMNPQPVPLGPGLVSSILTFFAWFILAALVFAFGAHWVRKTHPRRAALARRFSGLLAWTGSFGLLSLFFAYEQIPLLGMRFWFLLTFAYFLVQLGRIVWYVVRDYPRERAEEAERARIQKWMPKK